jgi:hypothetical protein
LVGDAAGCCLVYSGGQAQNRPQEEEEADSGLSYPGLKHSPMPRPSIGWRPRGFSPELFKNIVFPKCQEWEDAVICVQLFLAAVSVGYEYSVLYHHRYNAKSLTLKNDAENRKRRKKETYNNWHNIQKILLRHKDYYKYKEAIEWRLNNLPYRPFIVKLLKYMIPYGIVAIYRKWKSK